MVDNHQLKLELVSELIKVFELVSTVMEPELEPEIKIGLSPQIESEFSLHIEFELVCVFRFELDVVGDA